MKSHNAGEQGRHSLHEWDIRGTALRCLKWPCHALENTNNFVGFQVKTQRDIRGRPCLHKTSEFRPKRACVNGPGIKLNCCAAIGCDQLEAVVNSFSDSLGGRLLAAAVYGAHCIKSSQHSVTEANLRPNARSSVPKYVVNAELSALAESDSRVPENQLALTWQRPFHASSRRQARRLSSAVMKKYFASLVMLA